MGAQGGGASGLGLTGPAARTAFPEGLDQGVQGRAGPGWRQAGLPQGRWRALEAQAVGGERMPAPPPGAGMGGQGQGDPHGGGGEGWGQV